MRSIVLASLAAAAFAASAAAQLQLPQKSPKASLSQHIAATPIQVDYHRPAVRGRTIWGELVPYDKTWRAGANAATVVTFGGDVTVGGTDVPKGSYAFFVVPREKGAWTVVLNSVSQQWGSYNHDKAKDVASLEVTPKTAPHQEYLLYSVEPTGANRGELRLAWDKLQVAIPIEIDVKTRIAEAVAKAGDSDWQVYYQAASYHFDNKLDLGQAMTWCNKSVEIEQRAQNLVLLAQLLHEMGDTSEAIPPLKRAIELAKPAASANYVARLEGLLKKWESEK